MSVEEQILQKIKILISREHGTAEEAFNFFDADNDAGLKRGEVINMLKASEVSGFIRGIAATKIIEELDTNNDGLLQWNELEGFIKKAMEEKA